MNYNQLNYYHANPFYKQDFLPDRAWYNRQARAYPSELPSGKDFLPSNSRKHYPNKFNHSQIQNESILKSPERFPFENRIAQNKTYMRSLNTIDIEGASSNTRVNQSIKNKYKARDQINRQFKSMQMKQKTQQQKRRDAAVDYYHTVRKQEVNKSAFLQNQSRVSNKVTQNQMGSSNVNPQNRKAVSIRKDLSDQYKKFIMHNSSNKFHKDIPVVKESPHIPKNYSSLQHHTIDPSYQRQSQKSQYSRQHRQKSQMARYQREIPQPPRQKYQEYPYPPPQRHRQPPQNIPAGSRYQHQFNSRQQNSPQYQKIMQMEQEMSRYAKKPSDVRRKNPTNLSISFNVAGQQVVS